MRCARAPLVRAALAVLIVLACACDRARAQGTAASMSLDPSVLSSGMGGASTAVWWSAEPNYWANPALLGYYRGIRWQWGHTQLVPDVANDVTFDTGRFTVGGGGIGYEIAGHPIDGLGGLDLNYGTTGGFSNGSERIEASGIGVSLSQGIASLLGFAGHDTPAILRHVDVAGGYARKFTEVNFPPGSPVGATTHDWGVLAKAGLGGSYTANGDAGPLSLDASYGHAELNYDDAIFDFGLAGSSPPSRIRRDGVSARLTYDSYSGRNPAGSPMFSALMRGFAPLVTLGYAYDWANVSSGGGPPAYNTEQWGLESTLINVLTLRIGHVRDVLGDINDYSVGIGVALPITEYAGARYDFASYPEATGLSHLKRNSVSIWLNPIALHRALHPGS